MPNVIRAKHHILLWEAIVNVAAVQIVDVAYTYPADDAAVLSGVSLRIEAGEEIALVGHGGAGKSTLARLLSGLLTPTAGRIYITQADGKPGRVGLVFQNPENQLVGLTVEEDVAFGPGNLHLTQPEISARVDEALAVCGLTHMRERSLSTLSGGEKQRVAIAGALAMHPTCLVLDEATAMLDQPSQDELNRALHRVKDRLGIAILRITLAREEALHADRVAVLYKGSIVACGDPWDVLWNPDRLDAWGLALPTLYRAAHQFESAKVPDCRRVRTPKELAAAVLPYIPSAARTKASYQYANRQRAAKDPHSEQPPPTSLKEVSFVYPNTKRGLHPLSIDIPSGEWTALVGRSGSGKSTLLRLIAGLIQTQTGAVNNPTGRRPGLVMQFPEHHFFCTTVHDEIAFGLLRSGTPRAEIASAVAESLASVGLDAKDIADQSPFRLSGGHQRLVAIAATLALQPPLLLLDEPAAGLDPEQRDDLLARVDAWRRETGVGVLLSSHDMDEVARWADRLLVLNEGKLAYDGPLDADEAVFAHADAWGIGVPTGIQLLLALQAEGAAVPPFAKTPEDAALSILSTMNMHAPEDRP